MMSIPTTNRCLTLALLIGLAAAPWSTSRALAQAAPAAHADGGGEGTEAARELYAQGEAAYGNGDYETSVNLWRHAYELDPRIGLQYNLAQAYERLGRLQEAVQALELYVGGTTAEDPRRASAEARITSLRERITRTGVRIVGAPDGAVLLVDGVERGLFPHEGAWPIDAATHDVRVRADGFHDFVARVAVPVGQVVDVTVRMRAAELPVGGIVTMSIGAALVAGGLAVGALALDGAHAAPSSDGPEADEARTLALTSDVLWVTGAVAIGAGIAWLVADLVADEDAASASSASLRLVPILGPNLGGLSLAGTL